MKGLWYTSIAWAFRDPAATKGFSASLYVPNKGHDEPKHLRASYLTTSNPSTMINQAQIHLTSSNPSTINQSKSKHNTNLNPSMNYIKERERRVGREFFREISEDVKILKI
jgi:hypothetical protein